MGNSTQAKSKNKNVADNYLFVKSIAQGRSLYKHKITSKEYITLERTFPTSEMLLGYQQKMRKLLSVAHPYFLNETQHAMITSSTLCSMQYRVIHYFQYQPHTLQQELQTRKTHQKPFEQKEIWSILCGAVLSLAYLTKEDILCYSLHPKDIVIDKVGMIKILSPLLTDNGIQMVQEGFYYSPQHMKAFMTSNFSTITNKSSVFTLGITLLHILSLEPMNQLYDYDKCTINMQLLSQLIDKITQKEIKIVLRKMLKYHTYERITFTELEEMLFNILEGESGGQMMRGSMQMIRGSKVSDYDNGQCEGSACEGESATTEGLGVIVHKPYQSVQYEMQNNPLHHSIQASTHLLNYSTGHNHFNENNMQPKWPDVQDHPHLFISDSNIDYPIVDEKDTLKNQQNKSRLGNSKLLQNKMKASNFYDSNNYGSTRTALREMSNSNMNIVNTPSIHKQKQSFLKPQSKGQQHSLDTEQTTRPIHVREQLNIGTYQGYKLNNCRHGYGVFYYTQGGKYIGQWHRNKMQGRGALYYADQQIAYEGEWLNDKLHGFGILYNQSPTFMPHAFDFKSLHLVDNFWTKYEGNFYQDEKYGEGTMFLSNGEYYRGFFKQGLPHGNGVFRTVNNDIVRGSWVLGVMQ